jgi:quinone-reactive Ni/Fe-hydrogenase small subunit/[NiFe] hydrogenase small subunit
MALKDILSCKGGKNRAYYDALMKKCDENLARMDGELPPAIEGLSETLESRGVSRRDFLKWSSIMTTVLMLPPIFDSRVAKAAEIANRIPVVWLNFAECTGCTEAVLRSSYPNIDEIILETLSMEYHETIMAASGHQAEACLEEALEKFPGQFVCVIEGAIPMGMDGKFLTIGAKGKTGYEIAKEVTSKAAMVICIGSCSAFGNVPAAHPNPTNAKGVGDALGISTVNIPGCPPNGINFVGTILHYILFGSLPAVDGLGRPIWAYGKRIHDFCERRPHYDAAEFVEEWGDEYAKKGWCLYKMGCKGPYTNANCPQVRFNQAMSWPVMAGHGCIGCTEPDFWDKMAPLEKPVHEGAVLPFGGIEATADKVGVALTAITAAGIAIHAIGSAIRQPGKKE